MNFLRKLFSPAPRQDDFYWVTVKCNRCGEIIRARVDLRNDLSINYEDDGSTTYFCRKMLMGDELCFQRVEVMLTFDKDRNLLRSEAVGGQFVDQRRGPEED